MELGYHIFLTDVDHLAEGITDVGACRYDGIEIALEKLRAVDLDEVRDLFDRYDLELFCVMGERDRLRSEAHVERLAEGASLAADLDARFLAMLPPRRGLIDDDTFGSWLERVCAAAADAGVTPVLHSYGGGHVERPEEVRRWLDDGPKNMRLVFDTALYYPYGDVAEGVRRFADDIAYVHFKDMAPPRNFESFKDDLTNGEFAFDSIGGFYGSFRDLGDGEIDFQEAYRVLQDVGYDGPITIEIENQFYDPLVHTKRNFDFFWTKIVGNA